MADDTSVVRIDTVVALPITLGLTLCASERGDASGTVCGTQGRIVFYYALDLVQLFVGDSTQPVTTQHARSGLLEKLLEHQPDAGVPLLVDIRDTGAFMRVVEHPLIRVQQSGASRTVYDALGHDARSFASPMHRALLARAARWPVGPGSEPGAPGESAQV